LDVILGLSISALISFRVRIIHSHSISVIEAQKKTAEDLFI